MKGNGYGFSKFTITWWLLIVGGSMLNIQYGDPNISKLFQLVHAKR